jgi:hypothetical protein
MLAGFGGYRDARLYEEPRRRPRFSCQQATDPDFDHYTALFDEFLGLAGYFRIKAFIPRKRILQANKKGQPNRVQWMVPAYCGNLTEYMDLDLDPDQEEEEENAHRTGTRFYRDTWLALESVMKQLAECAYVHARGGRDVIEEDRTITHDPNTTTEYKNLLLAMILENR